MHTSRQESRCINTTVQPAITLGEQTKAWSKKKRGVVGHPAADVQYKRVVTRLF